MDWLLSPLGLTIESQAEEYSRRLTDDRTGIKTWNMGDMFKDVLTPGTRQDLEKAASDLATGRINKNTTKDRELIKQTLGNTNIDVSDKALKIREGETVDAYKARLSGLSTTGQANVNNIAIPGYDSSKVVTGMSASGVAQLGTAQKETNRKEREQKIEAKDDERYKDTRKDKADANALLLMNMENNQANLRADRELRRDQQAYQNRALDLKEARMDRRDRQAAIQQMMAGLAQLGASIAI